MNESLHKFMRVGILHFMAYPETLKGGGPIVETIRKIALDDYFDVVEISLIKDPATRKAVKKILETAHMAAAYGGQPLLLSKQLNINDTDEKGRQDAIAALKEGIDEAYEMGAEGFAFLSGKYDKNTIEEAYQALLKSTREICAYAKSKGKMKIILEVFDYDIDKKSLIGPASLARRYAADICKEYDNFGLMVDLSHLPLIRESSEEAILPVREYLVHAHIGNCVVKSKELAAYGDQHPRFGFPGSENGIAEVAEYLRVLLKTGFLNEKNPPILSFEIKPAPDEDPDLVIANAKRVLNRAWALV